MLLEQKTLLEEISRLQLALGQKEAEATRWKQEISDFPSDRKFLESEISARDESIKNLRAKISDLSAVNFSAQEISDLQGQVASLAQTNSSLAAELHARQSEISALRLAHGDAEAALARLLGAGKNSERLARDWEISRAREDVARKKEVADFERKLGQLEIRFARLKIQNQTLGQNLADVQAEARRALEGKDREISDLRKLVEIEREENRILGERNLNDRLFFEKIIREKHGKNFPEDGDLSPVARNFRAAVRSRLEDSAIV